MFGELRKCNIYHLMRVFSHFEIPNWRYQASIL